MEIRKKFYTEKAWAELIYINFLVITDYVAVEVDDGWEIRFFYTNEKLGYRNEYQVVLKDRKDKKNIVKIYSELETVVKTFSRMGIKEFRVICK